MFRLTGLALVLTALLPRVATAQSLYADPVARNAGDPITIVLAERTAARSQSEYADGAQATLSGSGSVDGSLGGRFGLDSQITRNAAARSEAVQSDLLSGTLSAVVVDVDANGNLVVEGERRLSVNGVSHYLRVRGLVRPYDLQYNNTVLSHQLANADVVYKQGGLANTFFSPGTLIKGGALVLLALAAFVGAS
ncbi:MAG: flagellar basal body L-ring protein FlgH [Rhodothermales bacterium]|nr:flagellar basal body L-ring protein FlgH [Rhodothermales bacterium]